MLPMKPILAIETSTSTASVALLLEGGADRQLLSRQREGPGGHAQSLLPMVDALLDQAQISRHDIGLVAFGQGPGAFTGIRLACSLAQALAFALGLPVVPVNALQAVAAAVPAEVTGVRLVALDARMDEIYLGAYDGAGHLLQRPVLLSAQDVLRFLAPRVPLWRRAGASASPVLLVGEGWRVVSPVVDAPGWQALGVALHDDTARPSAEAVALVAQGCWKVGRTRLPEQALPLYLREKVAFTMAEREHGLGGNPRVQPPMPDLLMPMTPVDLPDVLALERLSQAFPWSLRNFEDALAAGYPAWVVHRADRLAGFCVAMSTPDDIHVLSIAVQPDSRGQGLGGQLLGEVYQHANELGLSKVLLEVRPSNENAIRFYQKQGFTPIGRRKGYYPAGRGEREDALVMALDLSETQT